MNILLREVRNIMKGIINNDNHIPENNKHEVAIPVNTVREQNYLKFNNQFYLKHRNFNSF
jgi:hypothetical protein